MLIYLIKQKRSENKVSLNCMCTKYYIVSTSRNVCPDEHLNCNLHSSFAMPSIHWWASEKLLHCLSKQVLSHLLPVERGKVS